MISFCILNIGASSLEWRSALIVGLQNVFAENWKNIILKRSSDHSGVEMMCILYTRYRRAVWSGGAERRRRLTAKRPERWILVFLQKIWKTLRQNTSRWYLTYDCTYSLICWEANFFSEKGLRIVRWALLVLYYCTSGGTRSSVVSRIQNFGDPRTCPTGDAAFSAGDAASIVGYVHISRSWCIPSGRWQHLPGVSAASPAGDAGSPIGDVGASPKFWICDTTQTVHHCEWVWYLFF